MRNAALLILGASIWLFASCARYSLTSPAKPVRAAWAKPTWGPPAEGLQCRLRPAKRLWQAGTPPAFKVDVRNKGKRIFAFASEHVPLSRIAVDGRWHPWPGPPAAEGKIWPLAPGVEFTDLSISLPEAVHSSQTAGRHVVQVAFSFEGVEVLSNAVAIEIVRSP